ncbi:hypothetical protein BHM03_00061371, partial [Ensete ventricosum]
MGRRNCSQATDRVGDSLLVGDGSREAVRPRTGRYVPKKREKEREKKREKNTSRVLLFPGYPVRSVARGRRITHVVRHSRVILHRRAIPSPRYVPVRQLTSARTERYRAVPPKSAIDNRFWLSTVNFNHRWSISVVDDRLREKGEEEGEGEGEEKGEKYIARAALPRLPHAIRRPRAKNHPCDPSLAGDSLPASNSFSPCGEKGRGYIIST